MPVSESRFHRITPAQLKAVCVVPQCLDNQWVPAMALRAIQKDRFTGIAALFHRGKRKVFDESALQGYVRTEYRRSLIAAEQTIVNRSFFHTNNTLIRDFAEGSSDRESFKELLASQAILAFLFDEQSPFEDGSSDWYQTVTPNERSKNPWTRVCEETPPTCVRLSWDTAENDSLIHDAFKRQFHNRLRSLDNGDPARFLNDLRGAGAVADSEESRRFGEHLQKVTHFIENERQETDKLASREAIYRGFVVAPGTRPSDRVLDGTREFMTETKQLGDLIYNTNLTDALRILTLTPQDLPSRLSLQEDRRLKASPTMGGDHLAHLMRDLKFSILQKGVAFVDFGALSLKDVAEIRRTRAWQEYIGTVGRVVGNELLFDSREAFEDDRSGLGAMVSAYGRLVDELSIRYGRTIVQRSGLKFAAQLSIHVGGALITAIWLPTGNIWIEVLGNVAAAKPVEVVTKMAVGWLDERARQLTNAACFELVRRRFQDARTEWDALVKSLRDSPNCVFVDDDTPDQEQSTFNREGDHD